MGLYMSVTMATEEFSCFELCTIDVHVQLLHFVTYCFVLANDVEYSRVNPLSEL